MWRRHRGVIRAPDGPSNVVLLEGVEKVIFIRFIFLRGVPRGVRIYIVTNIDSTGATYVLGVGTSLQKWVIKLVEREEKNLTSNRIKYFLVIEGLKF